MRLTHFSAFPRASGRDDGLSASPCLLLLTKIASKAYHFLLLGSLLASFVSPAFGTPVPSLQIPKVTRPPKLSEFLEGTPREAEMVVTDFHQLDPVEGSPASQSTSAYLSYDDHNLYVGWICKDDPTKIRARVAKRKDIATDDRISVNLDTFHDGKHAYWFDVNPYGIQFDGKTTDGIGDDVTYETLWFTDGRLTSDGYVVLVTIPFRSLRFPQGQKQVWGVGLFRFIMRNNEVDAWPSFTHKRDPQWVGQFGEMTIPSGTSPGRNIQIIPYGLFSNDKFLDPVLRYQNRKDFRAGVDAKFVIRDSFTLDTTINPDFSQIESDAPLVTVNQRYEVVYPERRPFFMENSSVFLTPQILFFSRRIVNPQFGAKLTGSEGPWNVGVLTTDDRAPGEILGEDDPQHGDRAVDGVARVERQFGHESHLAAAFTGFQFGSDYNWVGSMDARLLAPHNWYAVGEATTSKTQHQDGTSFAGPAYAASLAHMDRNLKVDTYFSDLSPGFNAVLGYIPRVDLREWDNRFGYQWHREGSVMNSLGPGIYQTIDWNHKGELEDWAIKPNFSMTMSRLTYAQFTHSETYELYQNIGFRKHRNDVYLSSEPLRWLGFILDYNYGLSVNYYPPDGVAPSLGKSTNASASFTVRPTPRIKIFESYIYARLGTLEEYFVNREPASMFNNHIFRSNANIQFTREMSFSAIMDYNAVLPNSSLVSADYSKIADATFLFTYFRNPGTALYVGYSTTYDNTNVGGPTRQILRTQFPNTQTDRQLFAKLSYLFRF